MELKTKTREQQGFDTIRILVADALLKANSGHPGSPMGLTTVAIYYVLKA